jgi:hypothetical protein
VTKQLRRLAIAVTASLVLVGGVGVAGAATPIGPHQHFTGLVNGSHRGAVVHTVCAGPVSEGRMGPVAGGQTMSVIRRATGAGRTGPFSQIYAWFVPTTSGSPPTALEWMRYDTPHRIPTSIQVPCDGTGQVEFSSCPYLAPCAYGWVPDYVKVTFENIAA